MLLKQINAYLATRRAAGYKLESEGMMLRSFGRFAAQRGETHVRTETAVEWAALAPKHPQPGRRLQTVITFARYAHAEDSRHEVPSAGIFSTRREPFSPFIFSTCQIRQLLEEACRLPTSHLPAPCGALRRWTYCTLFSLLAVTGMRISEALALRFSDVTPDGLQITKAKFGKSRLIPLHPTSDAGLERYLEGRRRIGVVDDHLFLSCRGTPLDRRSVGVVFRRIVTKLGLQQPGGRRPRVHDLRHGFAVRTLEACPPGRASIDRHVLALSTYMGHVNVYSTYWYLHTTPTLLADISDVSERFANGEVR